MRSAWSMCVCVRYRMPNLLARLFGCPCRRAYFTEVLTTMRLTFLRIRLVIRIEFISVRFFLDWCVLDLSHLLAIGWWLLHLMSRWVTLLVMSRVLHVLAHGLNAAFAFVVSLLRSFRFLLLCISNTAFKVRHLFEFLRLSLFEVLLTW